MSKGNRNKKHRFETNIIVNFTWLDRLKMLYKGEVMVKVMMITEHHPGNYKNAAKVLFPVKGKYDSNN